MKLTAFSALLFVAVIHKSLQQLPTNQIIWQDGNWAANCDFPGNNLSNEQSSGEMCSTKCWETPGCTHYAWAYGTCYKKSGPVSKADAVYSATPGIVCGITVETVYNDPPKKGALIYQNEFDSPNDLIDNWNQETGGHGWGNNELQYYTNGNRNAYVSGGLLTIETKRENFGGNQYTSARLISKRKFKYGVFEMRARLPFGRGTWPAFWLLASKRPLDWPTDGEIDIMEHVGFEMNVVHATIHCKSHNHLDNSQIGRSTRVNDVANEWHTYQLEWTPNRIIGFIDDKSYFIYNRPANSNYNNWPFDNDFDIIINTAVGGNWGGALGVDTNIYPQKYLIDYVRVWNVAP